MSIINIIKILRGELKILKSCDTGIFDTMISNWEAKGIERLIDMLEAEEDEMILKRIRLYCEGKSVIDVMELIKLGL